MQPRLETLKEKYKSQLCKKYHTKDYCSYGLKCNFIHIKKKEDDLYYTKLNNLKTKSPFDIFKRANSKRLSIFQNICKNKCEHDSDYTDLDSLSTNEEREKFCEDNLFIVI